MSELNKFEALKEELNVKLEPIVKEYGWDQVQDALFEDPLWQYSGLTEEAEEIEKRRGLPRKIGK